MVPAIELRRDEIIGRAAKHGQFIRIEGINQAEKGIHVWNMKIKKVGKSNSIGVISYYRVEYTFNLNSGLWSGYEDEYLKAMDIECELEADVKLTLDCNNWMLVMDINENKHQLKLKQGRYRLRMKIWTFKECNFVLLHYAHTV